MPFPLAAALIGAGSLGLNWLGQSQAEGRRKADLRRIMELFEPGRLSKDSNALFDAFRSSPMYGALQTRAMSGATSLASGLNNSFARRGLGTSGIAAAAMPMAKQSFTQGFQEIDADLFSKAVSEIMGMRKSQAAALGGYQSGSPFGSAFGKTLDVFGPYIRSLMAGGGGQDDPFELYGNLWGQQSQ